MKFVRSWIILVLACSISPSEARSSSLSSGLSVQNDKQLSQLDHAEKLENLDAAMSKGLVALRGGAEDEGLINRLKIGAYFGTWYALNIMYNIVNKKMLNAVPAPFTIGSLQFLVGALYSTFLWTTGLRAPPKLSDTGRKAVAQIGFFHSWGQLASMISLGAGPVSFTHIVKALEPFFSALVSALLLGKWMKPQVYASLIPVVGGVGYACLKEKFFSWLAFNAAMASNVLFALRAVCSKSAMTDSVGENITSANLFGLVTWAAFLISVPMFIVTEGSTFLGLWETAAEQSGNMKLVRQLIVSGLFHYLNNEVMYLALSNVHPVTLAVGNTMKRCFIMVASVMVFRNPISLQAALGSAVGISGVLLYSLTKQYYEKVEAEEVEEKGKKRR
eukprot:CAMPEP_0194210244 /NCGR_PEP_ID=MMETSP0156-20130528/8114_1 /TAXON_ID=33649 /ORGANISM="Thalassionema nitzschioides, Strain L26-B" /LENGTH=388 /DNA_ID=CAMNT_0038937569 /DNA_START=45 /DNA_END=1211 /DNA_ORIENTATION=-